MDNQRFLLWASLGLVLFLIYQAWMEDYHPRTPPRPAATDAASEQGPDRAIDAVELPTLPDITQPTDDASVVPVPQTTDAGAERVRVLTDVLDLQIETLGGSLVHAAMLRYPVEKSRPDQPVILLDTTDDYFVAQMGLHSAAEDDEPNHRATWVAPRPEYRLADGSGELVVTLRWQAGELEATRTYLFRRGSYQVDVETRLNNRGTAPWRGVDYVQLIRKHTDIERSFASVESYSYRGPAVYDGEKYEKLDAGDLENNAWRVNSPAGWVALIQHHFLVAAVPPRGIAYGLEAQLLGNDRFLLRTTGPARDVAPGSSETFKQTLFVGPKLQKQLQEVGPKLALTVDYGFTTIIAQPLFWILNKIHSFVGNWGWSIILLTLLIKIVFYKLAETSGRSMAKMRKLQPRMKALQERYKDDRQKLSQAMMELYKQEKANPAAGCLPLLVQMPVFFALYWVLIESVELRQAPWVLWINDLSSRDPYFILPVLMGISMFAMQKLNPQPTDPVQAKVMLAMPLLMGAFMAVFPSGLVLYWLVNNLLSIAQQWRINKVVEAER